MTPQPDALPACPHCGGETYTRDEIIETNITEYGGNRYAYVALCKSCQSSGPMRDSLAEAIAAFTRPAHAFRAALARAERAEALVREAGEWLRRLEGEEEVGERPPAYAALLAPHRRTGEAMTDDESRLKEIEERCEKAAPEPWCSHDPGMYCGYACTPDGCYENHDSPVRQLEGPHTEWPEPNGGPVDDGTLQCFTIADADFIAHARSDIPYLISELRASIARAERAECERLRAEVVRLRERVAFFNGAVPTMVQCFDTLVSGLDGNKHSVERSIKGLREYVAKLKADAALSTAQQGGNQ